MSKRAPKEEKAIKDLTPKDDQVKGGEKDTKRYDRMMELMSSVAKPKT